MQIHNKAAHRLLIDRRPYYELCIMHYELNTCSCPPICHPILAFASLIRLSIKRDHERHPPRAPSRPELHPRRHFGATTFLDTKPSSLKRLSTRGKHLLRYVGDVQASGRWQAQDTILFRPLVAYPRQHIPYRALRKECHVCIRSIHKQPIKVYKSNHYRSKNEATKVKHCKTLNCNTLQTSNGNVGVTVLRQVNLLYVIDLRIIFASVNDNNHKDKRHERT